jgi:S-DNA-T family DNA segregation ATPase FtsK/SpoIIIE
MAKQLHRKSPKQEKESKEPSKGHFEFTKEKRQKIYGLLFFVIGIILIGSLLSFSHEDIGYKNSPGTLSNPSNWFGLFGVSVAYFFIESTIGVFSLFFPFVLFIWGYAYFFPLDSQKKIKLTSILIIIAVLLSTLTGIIQTRMQFFDYATYLSGNAGRFLAGKLTSFLGTIGGVLLIVTALITVAVYAVDFKIERFFEHLKEKYDASRISRGTEVPDAQSEGVKINTPSAKKVKESKKEGLFSKQGNGNTVSEPEAAAETSIRIKKRQQEEIQVKEAKEKESKKKEKQTAAEPVLVNAEHPEESKLNKNELEDVQSEVMSLRQEEAKLPEPWDEKLDFVLPPLDLLNEIPKEDFRIAESELRKNAEQLKEKLALFDIQIDDIEVTPGPVVTLYEIKPAPGVKISRIVSLENDIALALAARGIRIIAPIPGKSAIGVEIPNSESSMVVAKAVLLDIIKLKAELPMALGKTIAGDVYSTDLAKMPHLLVAGSTGSGKSVGINMMIASLLFSKTPAHVKLAIIDPKKIELSFYQALRQHYLAVCPDIDEDIVTAPMNAVILLKSVEMEMEHRYDMLAKAGVRNIVDYNIKVTDPVKKPKDTPTVKHHFLPYIVVIIDELADLMITAGKEVEEPIARLAQLARAVGIHLILATQRPSVNVITGVIKANFSTRIAYQVATKIDSRTILDMNGAEQLLGRGDMLFLPPGMPKPVRLQNAFISTEEVERVTEYIKRQPGYSKPYYLPSVYEKKNAGGRMSSADLDALFEDAAKIVVQHQKGSVSLLQRRLSLGYARAARIIDQMEDAGIVGPSDGSKARQVLVENEEQLETILRNL